MTRFRLCSAAVLCGGVLFLIFFKGWLSFFLLVFLLVLPLLSFLLALPAARGLRAVLRAGTPSARKGENFRFVLELKNQRPLPLTRAGFTLEIFNALGERQKRKRYYMPVDGRGAQFLERSLSSAYCGRITCEATKLRCYDYLGLFFFSLGPPQQAHIFVLPNTLAISPTLSIVVSPSPEGCVYSQTRPGSDISEVFDIRPYRDGDTLRNVHWKLSSRTNDLMVRVGSLSVSGTVELLLELAGELWQQDILLEALLSISTFLLSTGAAHRISFYNTADGTLSVHEVANESDLADVCNHLLSRPGSPGAALACRVAMESLLPCSRLLYLTPDFSPHCAELLEQLSQASPLIAVKSTGELATGAYPLVQDKLAASICALTI